MKKFIISSLLALCCFSVSAATGQMVENSYRTTMKQKVDAGIYAAEPEKEVVQTSPPVEEVSELKEQPEVAVEKEQEIVQLVDEKKVEEVVPIVPEPIPQVVEEPKPVVQEVAKSEVIQEKQPRYSDDEIWGMIILGGLGLSFLISIMCHEKATYFANGYDFTLSTLASIAALMHFSDNSMFVWIAIILANLLVGVIINGNNPGKGFMSLFGRLSGMVVFVLAIIASLFWIIIHRAEIRDHDDEDTRRRKLEVARNATITGTAIGGSVSYLVYKYFIDNTNVDKYSEGVL